MEKKNYYAKDYCSSTYSFTKRKLVEKSIEEAQRSCWKKNPAKAATVRSTSNNNDWNVEPYLVGQTFMTHIVDEGGEWYLNSCTLRHICNSFEKFVDFQPKIYKFVMTGRNIIRLYQVEIVILSLENYSKLTFANITYVSKYDSNLISLGQLQKTSISYYNYAKCIVLKQRGKTIRLTIKTKNLFILNTQILGKTMLV